MNPRLINNAQLKSRRTTLRKNQTLVEHKIWSKLRNRQCCGMKFFRQYSIGNYILDFYAPKIKLAIELDGGQHNEFEIANYDINRSRYLKNKGVTVIRFWNNEITQNLEGVLLEIQKVITPPNLPLS